MKTRVLITLFLLAVFITACAPADEVQPAQPVEPARSTPTSPAVEAQPGQSFTLMEGETVRVEEDQLVIGVIEVIEDSRCPTGVECFWEGNAKVLVSVGDQEFTLTIGKLLEGDQNVVALGDGLSLRLLRLDPYPEAGGGSKDYQVTLIVERESSQPFNYPQNI